MSNNLPVQPRSRLRRLGCMIGVVVWFAFLMLPCLAIVLLTRDEVAVQVGDLPGQSIRLWLVSGVQDRGLAISVPNVRLSPDGQNACLETNVSFFLWAGENMPTRFCECYLRQSEGWILQGETSQACES